MSEEENSPGAGGLPKSHVLSYLAVADTPTRVRRVAGTALRIVGWINVVLGVGLLGLLLWKLYLDMSAAYPKPWTLAEAIDLVQWELDVDDSIYFWLVPIGYLVTLGISLLACAGPVGRGRKLGCYWGIASLVPLLLVVLLVGGLVGGMGIMLVLGIGEARMHPVGLVWLAGTAVAALIVLLLGDVIAFLNWIARHPITEKPAVPFLPGSQDANLRK